MDDLEKKKLALEVKKLQAPWYASIEFWKVIIPTVAVLATLYFTFGKGLLDSEKSKLEAQKEQLKLEILQFQIQKNNIQDSVKVIKAEQVYYQKQIDSLLRIKNDLLGRSKKLSSQLENQRNDNKTLTDVYTDDKTFYQAELRRMMKLEDGYLSELSKQNGVSNTKDVSIAELQAQVNYLLGKVKLTEFEKNDMKIAKNIAGSNVLQNQINESSQRLKDFQKKYQDISKQVDAMSARDLQRWLEIRYGGN